jgi:hypothetical protein
MKTRFRFLVPALALTLLAPAGSLHAFQGPEADSPILVGSRVRLSAPGVVEGLITGRIVAQDDEALTVEVDDRMPLRVQREAIGVLDVSTARKRQWKKGLLIGAGVGAVLFGVAVTNNSCPEYDNLCFSAGEGAAAGAVAGALYGAGIGALFKSDRWSRVSSPQLRVSVGPVRGRGVGASLALRF